MMTITEVQQREMDQARAALTETRRSTSPELETVLYKPFPVLDHGFVRVVDYMGNDSSVVQAARVSYGAGTKKVSEDRGLINYLMRHWHTTPFEMCEIKYHVKLPIFVARQWIRHRTANVNEYSGRYSIMEDEFYLPAPEHLAVQSTDNRQGRGEILDPEEARRVLELIKENAGECGDTYRHNLNDDGSGKPKDPKRPQLARELARIGLTLNYYTQWYWKIDLNNLMHFLRLRADPHAQYEIRAYAEVMISLMEKWVPMTYAAFREYRLGATSLSKSAKEVVARALKGEAVEQKGSGLTKREWEELMAQFPELKK